MLISPIIPQTKKKGKKEKRQTKLLLGKIDLQVAPGQFYSDIA